MKYVNLQKTAFSFSRISFLFRLLEFHRLKLKFPFFFFLLLSCFIFDDTHKQEENKNICKHPIKLFVHLLFAYFFLASLTVAFFVPRTFFIRFLRSLRCFLAVFFASARPCRVRR